MADAFIEHVADRLAVLPGVVGVHFGGSRAAGSAGPSSDWDCAIYYRENFDVTAIRQIGWRGEVTDLGGWGPVMNGAPGSRSKAGPSMSTTGIWTPSIGCWRRRRQACSASIEALSS